MTRTPVETAFSARLLSHCACTEIQNGLEIQAFWPFGGSFHRPCCPIQAQGLDEVAPDPERAADDACKAGEAQPPLRQKGEIPEYEVGEESRPHLPPHGVLAVADEVMYLTGLLELLEERLDAPAITVDLGHRARGPREVVGQEHHLLHLSLDLDDGRDAAQRAFVLRGGRAFCWNDDLVLEDLRRLLVGRGGRRAQLLDRIHLHVPLLARHEPHAALVGPVHEPAVRVGSVRDGDVAALQVRGQLRRPHGIVVRGVLDDGERREPVAEVEREVELRGGLRAAVPRPVEAVHRELDGGGVDREHRSLDAEAVAPVRPRAELRRDAREVVEHPPVKVLRHVGRSFGVGVRERVAHRRRHAHRAPERLVRVRDVADRIERLGLRHLTVEHCRDMAFRREGAAQDVMGFRCLDDELRRYGVDYLTDNRVYCLRCFRVGGFHNRIGYPKPSRNATQNCISQITNGMLV